MDRGEVTKESHSRKGRIVEAVRQEGLMDLVVSIDRIECEQRDASRGSSRSD